MPLFEVKGDFCGKAKDILVRHQQAEDYIEISLDSEYFYNLSLAKSLSELESVRSRCICGLTCCLGEIKLESGRAGGGILKCAYTRLLSSRLTQTTVSSSAFVAMMQTAAAWERNHAPRSM